MSGGISATTIMAAAAVAGAATTIYSAMNQPKAPKGAEAPPAPEAPPQASKAPDVAALKRQNAGGGSALTGPAAGNASTFLTGPSGVDNAMLNLGKSKLLGQ